MSQPVSQLSTNQLTSGPKKMSQPINQLFNQRINQQTKNELTN